MAIYIPTRTRRRRAIVAAGVTLVIGLVLGFVAGQASAPSAQDQIRSIQDDARETAAGLRVIALHGEAGTTDPAATGADGDALVLSRTKAELLEELDAAAWISTEDGDRLLAGLDELAAIDDRSSRAFGEAAADLTAEIDKSFGTATS